MSRHDRFRTDLDKFSTKGYSRADIPASYTESDEFALTKGQSAYVVHFFTADGTRLRGWQRPHSTIEENAEREVARVVLLEPEAHDLVVLYRVDDDDDASPPWR